MTPSLLYNPGIHRRDTFTSNTKNVSLLAEKESYGYSKYEVPVFSPNSRRAHPRPAHGVVLAALCGGDSGSLATQVTEAQFNAQRGLNYCQIISF